MNELQRARRRLGAALAALVLVLAAQTARWGYQTTVRWVRWATTVERQTAATATADQAAAYGGGSP